MQKQAIIVNSYDPGYLRIIQHLAVSALNEGSEVVVIDTTAISSVPVDTYDRRILKVFGLSYPGATLESEVESWGATFVSPNYFDETSSTFIPEEQQLEELEISIQSALITYFRTDSPNRNKKRIASLAKKLRHEGIFMFQFLSEYLSKQSIEKVYVPNGRFPQQKMAVLACSDFNIKVIHYEKGEKQSSAYLQPYAPQNRIKSQESVEEVLAGFSLEQISETAQTWQVSRRPSSNSMNEFSDGWAEELPKEILSRAKEQKIISFFTSSQDEFQFLGPEWQLHSWESQFEAFNFLIGEFESLGFQCLLRVHPNLATKAQDCFHREIRDIRELGKLHPDLLIIWHDENVNTYALLDVSQGVVVWDSTVGLEASADGIPVWTCATSRYGMVADVREILGIDHYTQHLITPWVVDQSKAAKYICYLVERDLQLETEINKWTDWDAHNPPFGVSLSKITVSGGAPTILESLISIVDVWRNRSVSSNWSKLRRKIISK